MVRDSCAASWPRWSTESLPTSHGYDSVGHTFGPMGQPEVAFARAGALLRFDGKSTLPILSAWN
jgi:hypothetical protein